MELFNENVGRGQPLGKRTAVLALRGASVLSAAVTFAAFGVGVHGMLTSATFVSGTLIPILAAWLWFSIAVVCSKKAKALSAKEPLANRSLGR